MSSSMDRRLALMSFLTLPAALLTNLAGCGGDPNQRVTGTMVTPSYAIERRADARGKEQEAAEKLKKKAKKK